MNTYKAVYDTFLEIAVPSLDTFSTGIERPSIIGYILLNSLLKELKPCCSCNSPHFIVCTSSMSRICVKHAENWECCPRKDHIVLEIKEDNGKFKIQSGKFGTQKLAEGTECGRCQEETTKPLPACVFNNERGKCQAIFHTNCAFRPHMWQMIICSSCFSDYFKGDFRCVDCNDQYNTESSLMEHRKLCRVGRMKVITKKPLLEGSLRIHICCGKKWGNRKKLNIHKMKCHGEKESTSPSSKSTLSTKMDKMQIDGGEISNIERIEESTNDTLELTQGSTGFVKAMANTFEDGHKKVPNPKSSG